MAVQERDRGERDLLLWFRQCKQEDKRAILRITQLMAGMARRISVNNNVIPIAKRRRSS